MVATRSSTNPALTNALLTGGMLAGPFYIGLTLVEMLIRPGFDPTRHDWSLLSNGSLGWLHILNFLITGALVLGAAVGLRQALGGGKGSRWSPLLLGLYGLGLIGAGLFVADPMNGFPPGTPAGAPVHPTSHGFGHIISGALGFAGLIAACFVLARRFKSDGRPGLAAFSRVTGVVFLLAFMGIASSPTQQGAALQIITLAFTAAVVLAWAWVTTVSAYFKKEATSKT